MPNPKLLTLEELLARVRATMPVNVTIPDPFTMQPIQVHREDVFRLLVTDGSNLVADGQVLAAYFAEFARAERACEYSASFAERSYKKWKAQQASAYRADAEKSKRKTTVAEVEDAYRAHADYEQVSSEPARWAMLAGLFGDLKNAMMIKSRLLVAQLHNLTDHERALRAEDKMERGYR